MNEHVAVIMDGNGRWAAHRGRTRWRGHIAGAAAARRVVEGAVRADVGTLTLFAFSTENWRRGDMEVRTILASVRRWLRRERETLQREGIRLTHIGDLDNLPASVAMSVRTAEDATAANDGMRLVLALNYGFRADVVRASQALVRDGAVVNAPALKARLSTADLPAVDLLVRTGGERRVSNFVLWEAAHAELRFIDTLWPDMTTADIQSLIASYRRTAEAPVGVSDPASAGGRSDGSMATGELS